MTKTNKIMKKNLILLLLALLPISVAAYTLKRVSVHDPSIVWEPNTQTYYIFGSHRAAAKTKDLMNWTEFRAPWKAGNNNDAANNVSFTTPAVTKVKKGGQEYDFNFEYPLMNAVMKVVRDMEARVLSQSYDMDVQMRVSIRQGRLEELKTRLKKAIEPY